MSNVFLYGTLRHLPLLEIVLGHVPHERLSKAFLNGYRVARARGQGFPLIFEDHGATSEGLLLRDVNAEERARLDYYELGFGYRLHEVQIGEEAALVYFPDTGLWQAEGAWGLERWAEEHWPYVQHAAAEIMGLMGRLPSHELASRFGMINARAAAKAFAAEKAHPAQLRSDRGAGEVEVIERQPSHLGFFRLDSMRLRHPRYDGRMSDELQREVFLTGDAALVLPYDPVRDRLLLIEQFRMGPFGRGDQRPWVFEPVAGRVDAGETPQEAARRECLEEANLELSELVHVADYYPSPGEVSTYFYTYIGVADLPDGLAAIGGLDSEGEDIKAHVVSFDEAQALVRSGEINIGPLLHLILFLQGARESIFSRNP